MEKLIGLIMIAIGAITLYTTYNNLGSFSGVGNPLFFLAGGVILVMIGIFLVIAQTD